MPYRTSSPPPSLSPTNTHTDDADERTAQYVNKFKRAFAEANISDTEVLRDPFSVMLYIAI